MHTKGKIKTQNKQYLRNVVDSASPMQLIVLLYDGAAQWLQMAKKEIAKNVERRPPNWTAFSHNIDMSLRILTHLQESLNHERAEDLSDNLFSIYEFLKNLIIKVNAYKQEKDIDDAIEILKNLKKSWLEAMQENSKRES